MADQVKPEDMATLEGRMDKIQAELSGEIQNTKNVMQLGFQGLRDQLRAIDEALNKKAEDCKDCKAEQQAHATKLVDEEARKRRTLAADHEARLRALETWKNKSIGALVIVGPLVGGLAGGIVTLIVQWFTGARG